MSRHAFILAAIGLCTAPEQIARAQSACPDRTAELEKRVRDLEDIVRRLQTEIAASRGTAIVSPADSANREVLPPLFGPLSPDPALGTEKDSAEEKPPGLPTKTATASGVHAGWKDGFFLQSPDKAHKLKITGQIQADYRNFLDPGDSIDIDGFLARRVRFGLEATVANYYEFRLLPDYGLGRSVIQDAYLNVHYWDSLQLQTGKFKQPFSYEQLIQDRFVPTLERSLIDQLAPARDVGIMIHGQKLLGDRFDYAVAVANGGINGDGDTSNNLDVAGRLAWRPFGGMDCDSILHNLQIGVSATIGDELEPANPNRLRTPATVPWFQFSNGVLADGIRWRCSPEVSYFYRSLGFAAQSFRQEQDFRPNAASPTIVTLPFDGYQVLVTYLLTGETRSTYSQAITPLREFDPRSPLSARGAWEIVARASRLHVGQEAFLPGRALANPTLSSAGATETTLGFNWYLSRWVRWQFNWEHAWFDSKVPLAPGRFFRDQDTLLIRFQVIF